MRVSRRVVLRSLAGGGLAAFGMGAYGFAVGRWRFEVTRTTLALRHLPIALSGLRLGLISDIHCGEFMPPERVAGVADLLMREKPDLILLGGDHVTWSDTQALAPCAEGLASLDAPLGVFAVAGNHDPVGLLARALEARGRIRVLTDEHVQLTTRGESISLGGLNYWSQKVSDVRRVFRGASGFRILLAHDPRRVVEASQERIPLVLSGHTHGGQVRLPLIGAPAALRFPVVEGTASRNT